MEGNISSRTTNIQIYPTTTAALRSSSKLYHRASLSHTPQRGSSHTERTNKNNTNEQPAASSSSSFARRKPTPSLTVHTSSSPKKNDKAKIIQKKTPFHGSTEVILQVTKKHTKGTANAIENKKKKNTNKAVVAVVSSSSTRRCSSKCTYRLRRSPPSERKAVSKMIGIKATTSTASLRQSPQLTRKRSSAPQKMLPIEIVPSTSSTRSSSRSKTSSSNSRVSKSSSISTISHRLKLLNCFGQKHQQDDDNDHAVDDEFGFNHHHMSNIKKKEETTAPYLLRGMAQGVIGVVPTIVTQNEDKSSTPHHHQDVCRRRCRSPTTTTATVQGNTTSTTTTVVVVDNNKTHTSNVSNTTATAAPSAAVATAAASSSSSAPGARYPRAQPQPHHPATTRTETELETETETIASTDADTILSELKAEEGTLQQLLWKLQKEQQQHDFDNDDDDTENVEVDESYQRKKEKDDGTIDTRYNLPRIPESLIATLPPLTSSLAYIPKNLIPSPSNFMKTSSTNSSSFSSIPPPPPPLHLGVPQSSSSSNNNKNSVGSTALLSEAATTLGAPTACPRPVSSSPARTAASSGFSLPGNSIMSGYSISDGDGEDDHDLYATDLSSFAGFGGASRSITTNRSNDSEVVTMAAQYTMTLQQQEQQMAQQQQIHGTSTISTPRCHFCGKGHWIYQCPFMNPLSYQERDSAQCSTVAGGYNTDGYTAYETDDETRHSDVFDTLLLER